MIDKGNPMQAMAYAGQLGDDANNFIKSWLAGDTAAISKAWPGYFTAVVEWENWGKFDDQVISDVAYEALCDGEGKFYVPTFKRELAKAGLSIVGSGCNDPDLIAQLADALYDTPDNIKEALGAASLKLVPMEQDRGDGWQKHYGPGEQPWDTCLRLGWAAQGAAFSILCYLRRTKEPERDLMHARVYLGWLWKMTSAAAVPGNDTKTSDDVFRTLLQELSIDEQKRLDVTMEQLAL